MFKIGIAKNLNDRRETMNTSSGCDETEFYYCFKINLHPLAAVHIERSLHAYLAEFNSKREYFYIGYNRAKEIFNAAKEYNDKIVEIINRPFEMNEVNKIDYELIKINETVNSFKNKKLIKCDICKCNYRSNNKENHYKYKHKNKNKSTSSTSNFQTDDTTGLESE